MRGARRQAPCVHDRVGSSGNAGYLEMAQHYGMAVLPARPRKPKDKAKVETRVLVAQR